MSQERASSSRGYVVLAAAVGINLILGGLYAWGVMGRALVGKGWSKTDAAMPFAISTASFAIMMIFAGRLQDKFGPRWIATLGGLLFGGGMVASYFAGDVLVMSLTFGVLGGMGIGLGYSATTPPAVKWFPPARKGIITGIVVAGVGLASVYMAPLTSYLLTALSPDGNPANGIRPTFLALGIGSFVVIALFAQLLTNPPAGYVAGAATAATAAKAPALRPAKDWPEMLRTPQFYALWLIYVLAAQAGLMLISNAGAIVEQAGVWNKPAIPAPIKVTYLPAALMVMFLAIFNTLGRVVGGFVSDRIGRTQTMVLAFVLGAANLFAFSLYTTPELLLVGVSFAGLCYGTIFTLMPAATADFYGLKNLGVNYGLVFTSFGVAGVTGALVGGRVKDLLGSYSMAYTISASMLLAAAVLALLTKAPKIQSSQPAMAKAA